MEREETSFESWRIASLALGVCIGIAGFYGIAHAILRAELSSIERIPLIFFPLILLVKGDIWGVILSVSGVYGIAFGFASVKRAFQVEP